MRLTNAITRIARTEPVTRRFRPQPRRIGGIAKIVEIAREDDKAKAAWEARPPVPPATFVWTLIKGGDLTDATSAATDELVKLPLLRQAKDWEQAEKAHARGDTRAEASLDTLAAIRFAFDVLTVSVSLWAVAKSGPPKSGPPKGGPTKGGPPKGGPPKAPGGPTARPLPTAAELQRQRTQFAEQLNQASKLPDLKDYNAEVAHIRSEAAKIEGRLRAAGQNALADDFAKKIEWTVEARPAHKPPGGGKFKTEDEVRYVPQIPDPRGRGNIPRK